jgi:tripartite-type tricarboxylate transporter receptor subunit TctC
MLASSRAFSNLRRILAALALMSCAALPALGADYPTKPIRILIGYPPGSADALARAIANGVSTRLKQPVVVENKPGANTLIATQQVAQSPADGYTLLYTASPLAQQPVINKEWTVDPLKDLSFVATTIRQPVYFVISAQKLPVKNLKEFIAYAKANPGKLNFAMAGTDLGYKLFNYLAGTNIVIVPFKGEAPAVQGVVAGDADITYSSYYTMNPLVQGGRLRILGASTLKRSATLPDVPTLDEAGLPGYDFGIWHGILAPAATPRDVIATLNAAVVATMREPDFTKRMVEQGYTVVASTPEEFRAEVTKEIGMWKKLLAEGVISAQP